MRLFPGFNNRNGSAPRSIMILLVVAILAVGGLWFAKHNQSTDLTLGGPLFPIAAEDIEGFLLTKGKLQYRFDRHASGQWLLSGASNDYLDAGGLKSLLAIIPMAHGGAIFPGTETEDRRYEFNGPSAIRLRVFLADGEDISLALGTLNPVTGNHYASGAGRHGCFPVTAAFRDKLFMLPVTVQCQTVLPQFERSLVQNILLTRGEREHRLSRFDNRWWLLLQSDNLAEGLLGMPDQVRNYHAAYEDRRRQDADGLWIMASDQAVGKLIYEVSDIMVRDIKNPREAATWIKQWNLDPPWRQVVLQGPGLNADPGAPVADQFTVAFGPAVRENQAPALRRGNVLLVDFEAINLLEEGLDSLVEQMALNEVARSADHFRMEREGHLLIEAARTGEALTDEGRTSWQTVHPASATDKFTDKTRHGMSQDVVINLNRMEILASLPPTSQASVLADNERVRIVLTWDMGTETRELVLEVGFLQEGMLGIATMPDGRPPVGLWFPGTGKLLQVSDQLIVTGRSLELLTQP